MEKLIAEVRKCIEQEYTRASAKFGPENHSDHESYAVLLEEFDESMAEVETLRSHINRFWWAVKENSEDDVKVDACNRMETKALLAACELIQVAAMAKKARATIQVRQDIEDAVNAVGGDV